MRITRIFTILCGMLLLTTVAMAGRSQKLGVPADMNRWITTQFAKGKVPPFSFVYGGQSSTTFITKWKHHIRRESCTQPNVVRYTVTYSSDAAGLQVVCNVTGYRDFNAVDWVLHFTNTSGQNSENIEQLKVLDLAVNTSAKGNFRLLHLNGSDAKVTDFQPAMDTLQVGKPQGFEPANGRSSDTSAFPFFNLIAPNQCGVVLGIGWSGGWSAQFALANANTVELASGLRKFNLYLYPGESVRTSLVSLMFWKDDNWMEGNNKFRQFMLAHNARKIDGQTARYPLCGGFDWGDPAPCNEYTCLTEDLAVTVIRRYRQFQIMPEVMWLDAGWYEGSNFADGADRNWWSTVGTWKVDKARFPRGLKPISDEAHRQGAKLMVWFEPERVWMGSMIEREHPGWVLRHPDNNEYGLFDLGNPEAREWLQQYIGDFLEENGIDYYRQDFNMPLSHHCEAHEEPGRVGMREIRHVEGLYAYWDYLLQRFPNLLIDNCASGGRRLDMETARRSSPFWRTDYNYGEPTGPQCHTYGLSLFLPQHGTGINRSDNYRFRSGLSNQMSLNWELFTSGSNVMEMRKDVSQYKELREYFSENYYPLTGLSNLTGADVWLAYQLHRPSDQSGVVLAFRRPESKQPTCAVRLHGLSPTTTYSIYDEDADSTRTYTGSQLMEGIELKLEEAPGSLLLRYKPASE